MQNTVSQTTYLRAICQISVHYTSTDIEVHYAAIHISKCFSNTDVKYKVRKTKYDSLHETQKPNGEIGKCNRRGWNPGLTLYGLSI